MSALKRRAIGGTDVGPIVALYKPELADELGKYANASDVWMRIVHDVERPRTAQMQRGIDAEPRLRRAYLDAYGGTMEEHERPWIVEHPRFPWATVSPDDVTEGARVYVEFKSASVFARHKWGDAVFDNGDYDGDGVPALYALQVQHGLEILNLPLAHLFVGFGRDMKDESGVQRFFYEETRRYVIHRDAELAALSLAYCAQFHRDHVTTRKPPSVLPCHNKRVFSRLMKEKPWTREATEAPSP